MGGGGYGVYIKNRNVINRHVQLGQVIVVIIQGIKHISVRIALHIHHNNVQSLRYEVGV